MKKFLKYNGLSLAFFGLFACSLIGQIIFGLEEYNKELHEHNAVSKDLSEYLVSGHFVQSTFENWESEFLQMALFIVLTIFLQQKGSSESKNFSEPEEVDREPNPGREGAPWPVKKGGWWLFTYKYSLTLAFVLLFVISFLLHFYGSLADENRKRELEGKGAEEALDYLSDSRFWFESFQNWQSEFLSVFSIVLLSIWLRQQGSPQSKPVDASHDENGK